MNRLLILFIVLLPVFCVAQYKGQRTTYLTKDSISRDNNFTDNWLLFSGDSANMALPDYNDSNWDIRSSLLYITNDTSSKIKLFNHVLWLRKHIIIDSSLTNVPLAIMLKHNGASQVFVDGRKVTAFGTIKGADSSIYFDPQLVPVVFQFATGGAHVIAIRYANFSAAANFKIYKEQMAGIRVRIGFGNHATLADRSQTVIGTFILILLFGIFTALSLLHLFLFLFYRKVRSNLYYSIFSMSFGAIFLLIFLQRYSTDPGTVEHNSFVALVIAAAACFSLSGFSNELFSKSKLRFKIITSLCVLFIACWFYDVLVAVYMYLALLALVTLESIILTLGAIYRKVRGARIIGFGILLFSVAFLLLAVSGIVLRDISDATLLGRLLEMFCAVSILSFPISMSVYLAWSFSSMNKDLTKQLDQIQHLSDQALQQEVEKKELLARQNAELEQKVIERTSEVQHQKELVEIRNKSITDNVAYARRIQSAILPDIDQINKTMPQSFVLYLPKDIVSGDFYSFNKTGNCILIAAGDCTGHGVSGAFMSVIGSSLLNQIINEKGIEKPADILNSLNRAVIDTLKQSRNESNDGMDISVCAFSLDGTELQYAGANRPIYLVRNKNLEILKPDKLPIGGLQMAGNRVFANQAVRLQKGDTIYLFTDGYADQFGGELNKKMMVARFREVLLSLQDMDMNAQKAFLNDYFEKWKGKNDQVDDVLVIGLRI